MSVRPLKFIAQKGKQFEPPLRTKMQDRPDFFQISFLKREKAVIAMIIRQFDTVCKNGQFDAMENIYVRLYFPNQRHTDTLQRSYIHQLLAEYI